MAASFIIESEYNFTEGQIPVCLAKVYTEQIPACLAEALEA